MFFHRHRWDVVALRHSPSEHPSPGTTTHAQHWYWRCRCGQFLITVGGGEQAEVTGRIPEGLRDSGTPELARWLDGWVPRCKELEER